MMAFINGALAFGGKILSWMADNWAGLIVGAMIAAFFAYWIAYNRGDNAGYARYQAEQAALNVKAEAERKKDDATIQNLSDYDACVIGLRRKRLSVDPCEQLRGVHAQ